MKNTDQYKCPVGKQGRIVAAAMNRGHKNLTTWGLTFVDISPESIILDVGCGGGKTIARLTKLASKGKVLGIDHSAEMVRYSEKVNKKLVEEKRVQIFERSVVNTGFSDNYFDLVTAFETYYFWPNLQSAFEEIKRILKPKGKFLMTNEMIKDGVYEVKHAEIIKEAQLCLYPIEDIKKLLESVGFKDVKVFTKEGSAWNTVLSYKLGGN